ncbi:MAG: DUF4276 family protein [Magnetococcales bacterium]|nr:DUF4276 family protein [Magnetococcales bacterium]
MNGVEVWVIGEGQTEEAFVHRVLKPVLFNHKIFLKAQLISTSPGTHGGALNFDRVRRHTVRMIKEKPSACITTFFDLHRLHKEFPGYAESVGESDPVQRAQRLESAFHARILQDAGCRPEQFIPHIQPYEFEGLLFSDPSALVEVRPEWSRFVEPLAAIRQEFSTPEWINGGDATKPSARLEKLLKPSYRKTLHGPPAAERIGLDRLMAECPHFAGWVHRLRQLTTAG